MRSKGKICLCPASISWIIHHLKKSARNPFRRMIGELKQGTRGLKRKVKKRRSAKQLRATRKLIAFNKRRRRS